MALIRGFSAKAPACCIALPLGAARSKPLELQSAQPAARAGCYAAAQPRPVIWLENRLETMTAADHSLLSSYREMLLEHLFAGEVMRYAWLSGFKRLEVLKPQVDDGGYDLVLEANSVVRHVQLKATFRGSKVSRFTINTGLSQKPSGCIVVQLFDPATLEIGPFLWLGDRPGQPLPPIAHFPIAKHTKGNAQGIKLERPRMRVIPRSAFEKTESIAVLAGRLFGNPSTENVKSRPDNPADRADGKQRRRASA